MTLTKRIAEIVEHFEGLFKNKVLKWMFIIIIGGFSVLNSLGVYAQEDSVDLTDTKLDLESAWEDENQLIDAFLGDGEDVTNLETNTILSTLQVATIKMCSTCVEGGEEIIGQADVSDEVKIGVLEIVDSGVIAMLNNPPGVDVPSHLAQEWIPGYDSSNTSIYAVGGHLSGYEELQLSGADVLWSRVRNIAYVLFVVIMIVIGFMIMFRSKIGGQTMVTIGNAIPNVIISLVLVTFSFAIAGLIIDLGGLILIFISSIYSGKSAVDYTEFVGISGPFEIFKLIFTGKGTVVNEWMGGGALATGAVAGIISTIPALGVSIAGGLVGGIVVLLVFLVVAGIVAYGCIKVWIMLLKSYLNILLQVIAAPIILMTAALPGNMKAVGNWLKSIARNVLVFPATFALLNLPDALLSSSNVKLRLPGALVYEDPSTYTTSSTNVTGSFIIVIIEIVLIFVASQIPAFLEGVLPSNSSPAMQKAGEKSKEALSKMPIFGSMFGK